MNCNDALNLAHAYIDGELDLVKSLEIEQHLRACPACKVQYDQVRELAAGIRAHADYHRAPASLARPPGCGDAARPRRRCARLELVGHGDGACPVHPAGPGLRPELASA